MVCGVRGARSGAWNAGQFAKYDTTKREKDILCQ